MEKHESIAVIGIRYLSNQLLYLSRLVKLFSSNAVAQMSGIIIDKLRAEMNNLRSNAAFISRT